MHWASECIIRITYFFCEVALQAQPHQSIHASYLLPPCPSHAVLSWVIGWRDSQRFPVMFPCGQSPGQGTQKNNHSHKSKAVIRKQIQQRASGLWALDPQLDCEQGQTQPWASASSPSVPRYDLIAFVIISDLLKEPFSSGSGAHGTQGAWMPIGRDTAKGGTRWAVRSQKGACVPKAKVQNANWGSAPRRAIHTAD